VSPLRTHGARPHPRPRRRAVDPRPPAADGRVSVAVEGGAPRRTRRTPPARATRPTSTCASASCPRARRSAT
jgi:hypothetical protein